MAIKNPKVKKIYDTLKNGGADLGTEDEFNSWFFKPGKEGYENRKYIHGALKDGGDNAGMGNTYEEFAGWLGMHAVKPTSGVNNATNRTGQSQLPGDVAERRVRTRTTKSSTPLNKGRARRALQMQQQAIENQQKRWDEDNKRFKEDIARREQRLPGGMDRFEERAKEHLATGEAAPVPLAQNDEVVRGDIVFNPETGRMQQTYTTPEGGTFFDRNTAEFEHSLQTMPEDEIELLEREQELIGMGILRRGRELEEEYQGQSWWEKMLGALATDPEMGPGPRERMVEDDEELQSLLTSWRKNRDALRILYDKRNNDMNSFWHNFGTTVANGYTFTGGRAELHDAQAIIKSAARMDEIQRKMKAGEKLSNVENAALSLAQNTAWDNAIQAMYGDDYGAWAAAGGAAVQSLEMMPEFIAGMPVLKGLGTAAIKLLTRNAAKGFGRYMLKGLGMTLGTMAGGAIMANTIQAERTLGKAASNATGSWWFGDDGEFMLGHYDGDEFVSGGESLAAALFHAEREAIPEAASEGAGEFLPGIGQVLSKIGLSRIAKPLATLSGKGWYKSYQNMLKAAGWHGVGGEAFEEYIGTLDGLLMGDLEGVKRLGDPRTHIDIWLSCATLGPLLNAPVVIGSSMRAAYSPVAYHKIKSAVTRQDKIASFRLTEDRWAPWRERIDGKPNEQMADVLMEVRDSKDLAPQEKKAIFDYAKALQGYRGWNLGEYIFGKNAEEDGEGKTEQEQQQSQEYSNGYETVTPEERRAAKDRLDVARARLESKGYSEQWMQWLDSAPAEDVMNDLTERGLSGDTEAVMEYLNAKRAYDGMLQRVNDDIDDEVAVAGEAISERVAPENAGGDGMIHPAVLKGGREVFIISGNVGTMSDNSIDVENSDSMIIVRDADGNEDTISPDKIQSLGEVQDPQQLRYQVEQVIAEEQGQAAAAQIEGQLPFNVGDQYTISYQGEPHTYQVVQAEGDNVAVLVDGAQEPVVLTKQQLQQMADEDRAARIAAEAAQADAVEEEPAEETPAEAPAVEEEPAAPVAPEDNPTPGMPMDDQGEPAWDQVAPEIGHQYLYQESGWPAAMADNFVQARIDEAEKALKKAQDEAQKLIDKPKKTVAENNAAMAQNTAALQAAQAALDYWNAVKAIQAQATAPVVEETAPAVETPAEQEPTEQAAPIAETEAPVEPVEDAPAVETEQPVEETPAPVAENEMQPVEEEQPAENAPAAPVAEAQIPEQPAGEAPDTEGTEQSAATGDQSESGVVNATDETEQPAGEAEPEKTDIELLKEEFEDELSRKDIKVEVLPETFSESSAEMSVNVTVDGQATNIWFVVGEGNTVDEHWKRISEPFPEMGWQELDSLAEEYNQAMGKAVCDANDEAKRLNFYDIEEAIAFEAWMREREQQLKEQQAEAESSVAADIQYSIEHQGEVPMGNKQKKFDIAEANKSGDVNQPAISQGVYHDPLGYAVSTDGHILVADKRAYDKKNKGKLIASKKVKKSTEVRKGTEIKDPIEKGQPIPIERYPKWKSVKVNEAESEAIKLNFNQFADWLAGVEVRMKEQWQQWKDEHPDEKMSFNSWRERSKIQILTPDGNVRWFKFNELQIFARAAADQGAKTLRYYPNNTELAIQADSKNGFALLMPLANLDYYNKYLEHPYRVENGLGVDLDSSLFTYDMSNGLTMPGKTATGRVELNVESGKDAESRAYIEEVMEREGWDEDAKSEFRKILDDAADLVTRIAKGYTRLNEWNNKKLTDAQGNYNPLWRVWDERAGWIPTRSSFKKNGEYPYNIDLGALCTKREAFDAVVRYIKEQGWGQNLGPTQIEALKSLLREHGFLTACDICFNETKRARALDYGNAVAYYWNAVRQAVGIDDDLPVGTPRELTEEQTKILTELAKPKNGKAFSKYIPKEVRRTYETYINSKGKRKRREADKGLTPTMTAKIAKLFLQDPSLMGRFEGTTLLSTDSVDALVRQYPHTTLAEFIAGAWGSATPKPNEGFNVYDPLSWKQTYDAKRQRPAMDWFFNLGGFRAQSFSDYHPIFFYDYVQMFTDLAIRRLPIHIYTKVPALIKLFGGTGAKFNMSLVPEVVQGVDKAHLGLKPDGNGGWELAWHEDSFPVDEAFALREDPRYNGNVGTIAVGISDAHIRMLLDDPRIDMVIPYHKSGMPKSVQIKTGLKDATDYTDDQNTKGLKKGMKDFSFNEALRRTGDPRQAAAEYLAWCKQNKCTPKFAQFADHPNYYKMLEDFRCLDNEGNYSAQQPVQVSFFDDMEQRLTESMEDRTMQEGLDSAIRDNAAITEGIEKIMSKPRLDGKIRDMLLARLKQALGKDNVTSLKQGDFFAELQQVYTDQMGAERAQQQVEVLRTSGGIVYGFAAGGRIVLNEDYFNAETPMHEFTHVWVKVARLANPQMWAEGKELLKQTKEWQEVMNDEFYRDIQGDEDAVASEVLARIVGKDAARQVNEMFAPEDKPQERPGIYNRIQQWVSKFLDGVRSLFSDNAKRLTYDELIRMPMKALFDDAELERFQAALAKVNEEDVDLSAEEERTLMGMHNITAEKLRSALKLGGLANPSMAVINTEVGGFTNFGEISLIPSADLIASSTGGNAGTWGADAYSPRFPETHRRLGKGGDKKMRAWVKGLGMRQEMEYNTEEQFNDYYNGFNIRDNALVYPFLFEKGLADQVEVYDHNQVSQRFREIVERFGGDINRLMDAYRTSARVREEISDALITDAVFESVKKQQGESFSDLRKRRLEFRKEYTEAVVGDDGRVADDVAYSVLSEQCKAYNEGSQFNPNETRGKAVDYLLDNGLYDEYQRYFEQKMQDFGDETQVYAGSDSMGRSKFKSANLDEISRKMKRQGRAGGEGGIFSDGPGAIRAKLLTPMKTLDQIRKEKGRIVSKEEFNKAREEYQDKLRGLADTYANGSSSTLADILTSGNMAATAKQYGIDLDTDAIADLNEFKDYVKKLPTEYFETKFERPVGLNEFKKAVVPDDLSTDLRKALEDAGLEVVEYPAGDTAARERVTLDAVKGDQSIMFQIEKKNEQGREMLQRAQGYVDDFKSKYQSDKMHVVLSYDRDAMKNIPAFRHEFDNAQEMEDRLDHIDKEKRLCGISLSKSGEILIFADRIDSEAEAESTIFHENVHSWLRREFGPGKARDICDNFWNATSNVYGDFQKDIKEDYKKSPEWQQHEELFVYFMEYALTTGRFKVIDKYLTNDLDKHYLDKLLNFLRYDRREEKKNRTTQKGSQGGGGALGEIQAPRNPSTAQSENGRTSETDDRGQGERGVDSTEDEDNADGADPNEGVLFRELDDEEDAELIERLENGPKITTYSTKIKSGDGYVPPMSSKDNETGKMREPEHEQKWNESEERPDLAKQDKKTGKWKFDLKKSNDKDVSGVLYNPYNHSGSGMLNDQFSEAQDRDDLVVVEQVVPQSEETDKYKAEKANDPTGWKAWKAGPITAKMTGKRKVFLSRWHKITRVVPWSEVADAVAKDLGDQFDVLPTNPFPPQLRNELEDRGYKFIKTDNKCVIQEGEYKGATWSERYYDVYPERAKDKDKKAKGARAKAVKEQNTKELFDYAKKRFGVTTDFREAGYILPDGTMLDFSGRHELNEGDDSSFLKGRRTVDHRYVSNELSYQEDGWTPTGIKTSMTDFIERGAIRINGPSAINLAIKPTKEQEATLRRYLAGKQFVMIDFGNGEETDHYAAYGDDMDQFAPYLKASRILGDIDRYFEEGIKPAGTARFREILEDGGTLKVYQSEGMWRVEGVPGEFNTQFGAVDNARNFLQGHVFEVSEDGTSIDVLGAGSNLDNMLNGRGEAATQETATEANPLTAKQRKAEERARKWRERTVANGRRRVEELGQRLGVKVTIVDDMSQQQREGMSKKKRRAKGWYDVRTGEVFINLGNHRTVSDIEATFLHEVVAHKGLRRLFGEDFDTFLNNVYNNVESSIREEIDRLVERNGWSQSEATEEYLAKLAQQMNFERPEKYVKAWETVKRLFNSLLQKLGMNGITMKDSDLQGILFESYHNMEKEGVAGLAESVEFRDQMERMAAMPPRSEERGAGSAVAAESMFRDDEDDEDFEDSEDFYEEELEEEAENPEDLGEDIDDSEAGASTFQEMMLGKMLQAANSAGAAQSARVSAMRSLGGALQQIRKAMSAQRNYDRETVNTIVRLAREVMASGYFNDLTRGEVKRLLAAAKNVNGSANVTEQANKVVDTLLRHHLRECENLLKKQLKVKGSKQNASGVEVQAGLDIEGQRMSTAMKQGMRLDEQGLSDRVADCLSRMGSSDPVVAAEAAQEYTGLMLAQQYHDTIKTSRQEEQQMREEMRQAKAEFDARRDSLSPEELKRQRQDLKDYLAATEDAIRQNRMERADAYNQLSEMLGGGIASSMERAKQWREQQRERVGEIQHNANSDLEGVPADEHMRPTWKHRMANWAVVRFFMKPLATFDYMLRMMGQKSPNGEGYLWNRFMGGWVEANDNEWRNVKAAHQVLDEKVKEVFNTDRPGLPKYKLKRWSDLFFIERKMQGMEVDFWDGDQIKTHMLTPGNLLYIYMVNKMSDGKMKLRKMGISEEDVDAIRDHLDPRLIELADWLQDEFLVQKRIEYNAVHERMFGAPMAAIENYFPLKINSRSRSQEEDVNNQEANPDDNRGSTITGAIIKRVRNNKALDLTGADAFDVILEHIQNMEHWAAFAEFNRDLNTLLSYKRFRNRVLNMASARFGSGKKLWTNFKRVCAIASGVYRPKVDFDSVDTNLVNVAKGVTRAKISFRFYTALKQLLSYPAYLSTANPIELIKSSNPIGAVKAWNWAIDNLPGFAERWQSRQAGDTRLKDSDADWGLWKSKIIDTASRWGMSPNAFVDALTVAMGAKAIYETKRKQLMSLGYTEEQADNRARRDASVAYNETQQSSANAYTSAMQLDRTAASVALTVFRNASMGYQRRLFQSFANLKHMATKGYRAQSLEYLAKQMERDGLDKPTAEAAAKKVYNKAMYKNVADVAIFGWVMQAAWNLGAYLPYLFMGDDDDDKKDMLTDAALHAIAGGIEGLTGGSVMSDTYNAVRSGDAKATYSNELLPLLSDIESLKRTFKKDVIEGANDLVNLIVQAGVGVNPQTITDWVVAGLDVAQGDPELANEFGLLVMRIMSAPQGQLDKLYIDELGLTAGDARKLNAEEFANRYARYKMGRESTFTGWAYSEEGRNDVIDRYVKNFDKKLKERLGTQAIATLEDAYDRGDEHMKELVGKAVKKRLEGMEDGEVEHVFKYTTNDVTKEAASKEVVKRVSKKDDLEGYFDKATDPALRKAAGQEIAKRLGTQDYAGRSPQKRWTQETRDAYERYQELRTSADIREDSQIYLKATDDEKAELREIKKQLGQGGDDAAILQEYREAREEILKNYR